MALIRGPALLGRHIHKILMQTLKMALFGRFSTGKSSAFPGAVRSLKAEGEKVSAELQILPGWGLPSSYLLAICRLKRFRLTVVIYVM
jgi:hypothetical protein